MHNTSENSTRRLICLFLTAIFDENSSELYGAIMFACVLCSILAITASLFNSLVLLTIWKKSSLHTPANILIASLAVSDLGVGIVVQPLSVSYLIMHLQKRFLPYCIIGLLTEGLGLLLTGVSLLTLTAISVEKYLAISLHLRYKNIVTIRRTKGVIYLLWLVTICGVVYRFLPVNFTVLMSLGLSALVLCILVILFCNASIGRKIRKLTICVNPAQSTYLSTAMGIARFKKSALTLLLIVALFVVCFAPYGFAMILAIRHGFTLWIRKISYVTYPLMFLNSTLNPLLYWWRISDLRSASLETIHRLWNKDTSKNDGKENRITKLVEGNCMEEKKV